MTVLSEHFIQTSAQRRYWITQIADRAFGYVREDGDTYLDKQHDVPGVSDQTPLVVAMGSIAGFRLIERRLESMGSNRTRHWLSMNLVA